MPLSRWFQPGSSPRLSSSFSLLSRSALRRLAALCCLAGSGAASAQGVRTPEALALQSLAGSCAACHGTNGRAVDGASLSALAGMNKNELAAQMRAFQSGERPATVMHQISKGYNAAQIEALAGYFSAQPKPSQSVNSTKAPSAGSGVKP